MKILYFFLSFLSSWIPIRIRNLNADPDPATQITADPDPKPWVLHLQVMCALAGGKLLVNLKYISRSHDAGQWLNPEDDTRFLALPDLCLHFRSGYFRF
jgi:hypothetical protein